MHKQLSETASKPHATESRIREVGIALGDSLRAVLADIPDAPTRAVELSVFLDIDKTLAVRLVGAIKKQDPLAICHSMPGPRGIRTALTAAAGKGANQQLVEKAEESVRKFEKLVREIGGSRTAFNTIIGGLLPDVRERIERTNKKAAFDAMCNLLGHQVDASFVACIIQPASTGEGCDSACFAGKVGMRHLTPRVARMIWAQRCASPMRDGGCSSYNLSREPITRDEDLPIIREFTTHPIPELSLHRYNDSVYVALADDETPNPEPTNIFLGSYTPNSFLTHATPDLTHEFVSYTPAEPAKVSFVDVFVHEDIWPNTSPEVNVYRTGARGNLADAFERPFDRIDMIETVRLLGKGTDRIHTNDVENYASMVRTVFDKVGWESERFRVYRVRIDFPLLNAQILIRFELPKKG